MANEVNVSREDFQEYKNVQESGDYNMFDPRAREMTDLSKDQWIDIIKNYSKYREMYNA